MQIKAEAPHKYIVEEVQAGLFCSLFVVDMEGASDGRALKTILPQINPRKLVSRAPSCRAPGADTRRFAGHCQRVIDSRSRPVARLQGDQLHDGGDLYARCWGAHHRRRRDQELLRSPRRLDHGLAPHVSGA